MAILSMTEAAKQAGIGRTTLWRKAKSGVLSTTTFPDGSPGVDTAELFRVFPVETVPGVQEKHVGTEVELMKQEIKHLHDQLHLKDQIIETQSQALRLLEHRPVAEPTGAEHPAVKAILEAERTRAAALEAELTAERSRSFFSRMFGGKR